MARHKSLPDDALCDLLLPAITAHGPDGLTLALAAQAAGLSPATLIQRFGSRAGMVQAILTRAWDQLDTATDAAIAAAPPGAQGALDLLASLTADATADAALTDGLLLLREDMRNPALRARGAAWGARLAAALAPRLHPDPATGAGLAWQMLAVWQGALIWWGFTRPGPASAHVGAALRDWTRRLPPH